ncbi:ubiquinone/menaquinone biosynthesis C-methyltransferase UbiE-like [Hippocampus zosterae]|uniref:ubiquinone/menaquinone biosynthesis C-methyltransferase UbiE-like n=1 Tax=Hippocampus zosterae TaxID=109293 RepID=UPI00223E6D80|nr:ubiquinone/menaquinone biosynthesis C-methyltransferase UbiE-like [Hippocampus zosterae]
MFQNKPLSRYSVHQLNSLPPYLVCGYKDIQNYASQHNARAERSKLFCSSHFGSRTVPLEQKQALVDNVFSSVAKNYDLMNDAMSLGIHRYWKNYFVEDLAGVRVLDVAGGTGDIAFRIQDLNRDNGVEVTVLDINAAMLAEGRRRASEQQYQGLEFVEGNAEELPFEADSFDVYTIAFGLRNVPRTAKALGEAFRVLKKGGRLSILEFSKVQTSLFRQAYETYSHLVIPQLGETLASDRASYQYLVESIQKFYDQESLLRLVKEAGFKYAGFRNLSDGIVAIHNGFKL